MVESRSSGSRTQHKRQTQVYVKDEWVDALFDLNVNKTEKMQEILDKINSETSHNSRKTQSACNPCCDAIYLEECVCNKAD